MVLVTKQTHRKYYNARTYHCYKDGELKGIFPVDFKITEEELKNFLNEIKGLTNADKIILHWTAREGFVNKEVQL